MMIDRTRQVGKLNARRGDLSVSRVIGKLHDGIGVRDKGGYRMPVVEIVQVRPREDAEIEELRAQLLAL